MAVSLCTSLLPSLWKVPRRRNTGSKGKHNFETFTYHTTASKKVDQFTLRAVQESESQFLGRLIRSLGSPRRIKGSGAPKEETKVWSSQGGEKDKHFF